MTPKIIFQPRTDKLEKPVTVRFYERRKLTDYGDHVEWTNGKKTYKWRLPDQTDCPSEYPVLKHIMFVPNTRTGTYKVVLVKMLRVSFVAEDGSILAEFASPNTYLPVDLLNKILPDEAYTELESRGVTRVTEHYDSMQALYRAHPDRNHNWFTRSFAMHPVLWVTGVAILIVVGCFIYVFATGGFSSN